MMKSKFKDGWGFRPKTFRRLIFSYAVGAVIRTYIPTTWGWFSIHMLPMRPWRKNVPNNQNLNHFIRLSDIVILVWSKFDHQNEDFENWPLKYYKYRKMASCRQKFLKIRSFKYMIMHFFKWEFKPFTLLEYSTPRKSKAAPESWKFLNPLLLFKPKITNTPHPLT